MDKRIDLTQGSMTGKLVKLSLPIMGTSFIQMAYNLTDMMWIGKLGSNAVAAVGTAGFFPWLGMALVMISKIGAEIKIAHSVGMKDFDATKEYVISAIQINIVLAILYGVLLLGLKTPAIGFFNLGDPKIIAMAETYLVVMAWGMVFNFINPVLTGIFTGIGNSRTPFWINGIGLLFNIVFDPLLIFGVGPIPAMGVLGAAVATIAAQVVVTLCFIIALMRRKEKYLRVNIFEKPQMEYIKIICRIGLPGAVQNGLFTIFSMFIARVIGSFGPDPIAVQKLGSQIEAISWMTTGGISTALGTFVGQNYGAKKYDRIQKSYHISMVLAVIIGTFATLLFMFAGESIFRFFMPKSTEAIVQGGVYLRILGYSQLFMCIEITTTGLFNGLGRTYIPSIISSVLTGARIPAAYILSKPELMGINGVWWSISFSSILKGLVLIGIYFYLKEKGKLYKYETTYNEMMEGHNGQAISVPEPE